MTEREMLEWAAKAAGLPHTGLNFIAEGEFDNLIGWGMCTGFPMPNGCDCHPADKSTACVWNPLTDDGDALRLAVQCGIEISTVDDEPDSDGRYSRACAGYSTESDPRIRYVFEDHKGDIFCATRLAITRAAAEIGKAAGKNGG